jgi:hypothetical protein
MMRVDSPDTKEALSAAMPRTAIAVLALVAVLLIVGTGTATAATPIEGVWSFNGGQVAIQGQGNGAFTGTVVAPTRFSECYHPAGEEMWTQIRLQSDGAYFGLHQWYFATSECVPNPALGLTAWRVLRLPDGSRALRVCFSAPGSDSQPTIGADGVSQGATFGCSDSARISALPAIKQSEVGKYLILPSNRNCIGRPRMKIRIKNPTSDPFEKISVRLRSGEVRRRAQLKHRADDVLAMLNLRGLPRETFTVTVRTTTLLGSSLSSKRSYRVCSAPATVRARTGLRGQ